METRSFGAPLLSKKAVSSTVNCSKESPSNLSGNCVFTSPGVELKTIKVKMECPEDVPDGHDLVPLKERQRALLARYHSAFIVLSFNYILCWFWRCLKWWSLISWSYLSSLIFIMKILLLPLLFLVITYNILLEWFGAAKLCPSGFNLQPKTGIKQFVCRGNKFIFCLSLNLSSWLFVWCLDSSRCF